MKRAPGRVQSRAFPPDTRTSFDAAIITDALERLETLVPELAYSSASRELHGVALAYVERFQGDVLQLEHEWEFLYAVLLQAWQQSEYSVAVRLAAALAHLAGRLDNLAEAEYMLRLGIDASRRTRDRQSLASFLNRLGGLLFAQGKYRQGWRIWHRGIQLAASCGATRSLWEPLASFAQIADMIGSYTAAGQFVESLMEEHRNDDPDCIAVALFVRGFYARLMNNLDRAYEDFTGSLRLLSLQRHGSCPSCYRQLFTVVVQAELARVQGQYARSQMYTETAIALARTFSDRYTVAALLIDQGLYTFQQGEYAETHETFLRLREEARQLQAPHAYECSRHLEQYLASVPAESYVNNVPERAKTLALATASVTLFERLSEREIEVLRLVAEGFSNREIARRLVITAGTVKKHLEHIFTRLDVHSRTSAVARARTLKLVP